MERARRSSAKRLLRLDQSLVRRYAVVQAGGFEFRCECLDDLDQVIDQMLARLPPGKDPATGVAEVTPHFGVVWPSALALAEHLAQNLRSALPQMHVLELGCGLALPSMVASRLGARRVVASDRHPLVPLFLERNLAFNRIAGIEYQNLDWRAADCAGERFDLVIGSDLLYEAWQPGFLAQALSHFLAQGGSALIADPGRRYVDAFVSLAEASGYHCELASLKPVTHGQSAVEVLIVEVRRSG